MNSRRDFLKISAAFSGWLAGAAQAASPLTLPGATSTVQSGELYKVLGDARHPASVAFVAAAEADGLRGHVLSSGDISKLWLNELQAVWQSAPVAIAGLTDAAPLFCLEQLAGQYGLRVLQRETVVTEQGTTLLAWLIAPRLF